MTEPTATTSLDPILYTTAIGLDLHVVTPGNAAALVAAGLLSVVLFPAIAVSMLRRDTSPVDQRGSGFG